MIERTDDAPEGVIGLRASGKLTKADYTDVLEPALEEAVESGDARVLFVLEDFEGLEHDALLEDIRTGLKEEIQDKDKWRRLALVTDVDWIAKASKGFSWLMPGDLKVCRLDELEEAKAWVAE